jgi:hypothetical protein
VPAEHEASIAHQTQARVQAALELEFKDRKKSVAVMELRDKNKFIAYDCYRELQGMFAVAPALSPLNP